MKALDYRHRGEEPSPEEIVAALHTEIAAKSPEHAALVAAFEEKQRQAGTPYAHPQLAARDARVARYAELRRGGASREEAREQVGVTAKTAWKYERDMRLTAATAPQDRAAGEHPPAPRRVRLPPDPGSRSDPAGSPDRGQPPRIPPGTVHGVAAGPGGFSGAEFRARIKAARSEQAAARWRTAGRYVPVAARDPGGQYRPGMARRPPPETPDPRPPPESGPGAGEDASMRRGA